MFNMAHMGLRLGQRANGVCQLHGEVSREMFAGLWPGFDADEVPISSVTNGVHAPTWMAREMLELAEREVGADPVGEARRLGGHRQGPATPSCGRPRGCCAARLVEEVRRRVRDSALQRGADRGRARLDRRPPSTRTC